MIQDWKVDAMLNKSKTKKRILRDIDDLPSMPQVIHKARELLADPDSDIAEIAELIETDQSMAMRVMRLANAPYYRRLGGVSSVREASLALGMTALTELITMASTSKILGGKLQGYQFEAGALWKHSLAVAFGAKFIAQDKCPPMATYAFSTGLIHDTGKLILDPIIFDNCADFDQLMEDPNLTFQDAEKAIIGYDHAEIAAVVSKKWHFPSLIVDAIYCHHDPSRNRKNDLAHLIHIADQLAIWIGMNTDELTLELCDESLERFELAHEEIETYMENIAEAVNRICGEE